MLSENEALPANLLKVVDAELLEGGFDRIVEWTGGPVKVLYR